MSEGGSRTKVTSPALTGGTRTITEIYVCHSGSWRLWKRVTIWSSSTGMAIYPPGAITESGTRKESFDTATGCLTYKDEMIKRSTKTQPGLFTAIYKDDRCIWTVDTTDCENPESASHLKIERWVKTYAPFAQSNWINDEAGYTETMDSVGYDAAGNLVEDSHSNYLRRTAASELFVTPIGTTSFMVSYYETGETVDHPMSYYANYLIGGGPSGGNVWSGASQIPQWDGAGNFLGYYSETIGQILARAKSHEYLLCGSDDGSGWPWMYPRYPMP